MRVTHVITRLIIGGAQENTVDSVLGLRQQAGLSARLICGPTGGPEGSLESSFAKIREVLTVVPPLVRAIHPWKDCRALIQLTRLLRAQAPDVVHTHSGKAGILGRLAARRAGVPIVVHTIHGPSFGPFQSGPVNQLFRAAERYAAPRTTHFVSVAEAMTSQYLAAGIGCPEQFTCIRSGFALESFLKAKNDPSFRKSLGLAQTDFVVGKIARLIKLKGHSDLLAAAPVLVERCPRIKFLLVGDGPWQKRLKKHVRALGLEHSFVFAGLVSPSDIPRYLGVMDVLVHLSRREGLARALPQALAAGRPVLSYDCDGAKEICIPDETGFLIRFGDVGQFTERLLQLANAPELREKLGRRGQTLVQEWFSVERMVEQLCLLYKKLARETTGALSL